MSILQNASATPHCILSSPQCNASRPQSTTKHTPDNEVTRSSSTLEQWQYLLVEAANHPGLRCCTLQSPLRHAPLSSPRAHESFSSVSLPSFLFTPPPPPLLSLPFPLLVIPPRVSLSSSSFSLLSFLFLSSFPSAHHPFQWLLNILLLRPLPFSSRLRSLVSSLFLSLRSSTLPVFLLFILLLCSLPFSTRLCSFPLSPFLSLRSPSLLMFPSFPPLCPSLPFFPPPKPPPLSSLSSRLHDSTNIPSVCGC